MIFTIFKPKRVRNGKAVPSRLYRGRYRLEGDTKITDIPLHASDKQIARQKLEEIVRQRQLEKAGIVPRKEVQEVAKLSLADHLAAYAADLTAVGRDDQYIYELKNRVIRLIKQCGWTSPEDVSSNSFVLWRSKQTLAAKTLNEYLTSASSLMNWLVRHRRYSDNPLKNVSKVDSSGKPVRPRRAFTPEEMHRLLSVAGRRRVVYTTAVFTGLRRNELKQIQWENVFLDCNPAYLVARCWTTKNKKHVRMILHPDAADELRKLRAVSESSTGLVFADLLPKMTTFRADLKRAKIDFLDSEGRRADFHSLRHTLSTNLAVAGTAPRVAMEVMRHSDIRLTTKVYTDTGLLPVPDAVLSLPSYQGKTPSQIASQKPGAAGPAVSLIGAKRSPAPDSAHAEPELDRQDMTSLGSTCLENQNLASSGSNPVSRTIPPVALSDDGQRQLVKFSIQASLRSFRKVSHFG